MRLRLPEPDEFVGRRIGEGTHEDGIDYAEDGGVGANAESEREDSDEGEATAAKEHTQPEANILKDAEHGWPPERATGSVRRWQGQTDRRYKVLRNYRTADFFCGISHRGDANDHSPKRTAVVGGLFFSAGGSCLRITSIEEG